MGGAYFLGAAAHLLIADTWQWSWLVPDLFLLAGALTVLFRPCALGYALCLPGLLWPLLFLRDQLTQSVLLTLFAASALLALLLPQRPIRAAQQTWRMILVSTYGVATLHKINRDFLDPTYSCANYGVEEIFATWHLPHSLYTDLYLNGLHDFLPWMILATESALVLLYLLRLRRLAWLLAIVFHIPLTMTMAPAFVFVMAVGHAAWCEQEDVDHVRRVFTAPSKKSVVLLAASLAMGVGSLLLAKRLPEPSMMVRELFIWFALGVCMSFALDGGLHAFLHRAPPHHTRPSRLTIVFGVMFLINAVVFPYTGRKMQHAGAMLSNLRIDQGCWNSLVFPESLRTSEDYLRVEEVYFKAPGVAPEYERLLREQLWSPPQLRQMQRHWCAPSRRPFFLRGSWQGEPFLIEDLCTIGPDALPFPQDGVLGVEIFPDALRFQKNLQRACPQKCIH